MYRFQLLQDFLASFKTQRTKLSIPGLDKLSNPSSSLHELVTAVLQTRGEASALAHAEQLLTRYESSTPEQKLAFFQLLQHEFDLDAHALAEIASAYRDTPSAPLFVRLQKVSEPKRRELLRRLNMIPNGTEKLVNMRSELLPLLKAHPELQPLDEDFVYLFRSWFNRGFLMMRPIDWHTPANILEKIIAYEAVHEISSWQELRQRLEPEDRRCFAFFHPVMPEEPLIFVQVALTSSIPSNIATVLDPSSPALSPQETSVAAFYSISNCQYGLKGISFGSFLIKQVALELKTELPQLKDFVTLSPIPGFMRWLRKQENATGLLQKIDAPDWQPTTSQTDENKQALAAWVATYLLQAKKPNGSPADPVARFHLGNGARLERINTAADLSDKGCELAAGAMVNYYYDLNKTAHYHELYSEQYQLMASKAVTRLLTEKG